MSRELKGLADALVAGSRDTSASTAVDLSQGRASRSRLAETVEADDAAVQIEDAVIVQPSKTSKQAPKRKKASNPAEKSATTGKRKKRPIQPEAAAEEDGDDAALVAPDAAAVAAPEDAVEQAVAALAPAVSGAASRGSNLRQAQAKVARDRAAHFARADKTDREPARSSKPAQDDEWCGPFATARKLLNERAAAAAARKLRLENGTVEEDEDSDEEGDGTPKRSVKKVVVQWTGNGQGSLVGRTFSVPPLFQLCLQMLCANFECVEDLGDVTAEVRNRLAALLCRQLKLTPEVLERIAGPGVTEVVLPDCSRIDAEQMLATLYRCRATLTVLELRMCGRCFDDETVAALTGAGGLPALVKLCLSGSYRLSDAALGSLLAACPRLQSLELPQNCLLGSAGIDSIVRHCGASLVALSLGTCEQLSAEALGKLTALCKLQALDLSGLPNLTDALLAGVLQRCGSRLQALSIADCEGLTAEGAVAAISSFCGGSLASLNIGCNPAITSDSAPLTVLFEDAAAARAAGSSSSYSSTSYDAVTYSSSSSSNGSTGGGSSVGGSSSDALPQGHPAAELHTLSIRSLRAVEGRSGDEATVAMAQACAGTLRKLDLCGSDITDATLVALAQHCSSSLVTLDLSFCRSITNQGLGHLVDRCEKLQSLLLWGNIHIGDEFLKKHSRENLHVVKS